MEAASRVRSIVKRTAVVAALLVGAAITPVQADNYVTQSSIGPAYGAHDTNTTAFIHSSILTFGSQQFVTYYNDNENVTVARRTLGTDLWDVYPTTFTAFNITDGHDVISFGIDGDGYMHMSWGMHGDSLQYAKSTTPVTGSGPIAFTCIMAMTGFEDLVTYPQFYELADGDLLFLFREITSGNGNTFLNRYDVSTGTWSNLQNPAGQRALFRGSGWTPDYNLYNNHMAIDSTGALLLTGTIRYNSDSPTGHSGFQTNHDLFYMRSDDEGVTWKRTDGSTCTLPVSEFGENGDPNTKIERVLTIPEGSSLINQCSMTVDNNDLPVFAMYWAPDAASGNHARQYMLGWYDGAQWQTSRITNHFTDYDPDGDGVNAPIPESQLGNYHMARPAVMVDDEDRVIVIFSDYHRGQLVTAAYSADRVNWTFVDLTSEDAGGWEPTIDQELWRRENKVHMLYHPTRRGSVQTARVLEWDASAYLDNPPPPPVLTPNDVIFADNFNSPVLGDPATQSGLYAPVGYSQYGPGTDFSGGSLQLNTGSSAGSSAVTPVLDLGTDEVAAFGGYMVTLTGVDPVVGGDGADSDWMSTCLLRQTASPPGDPAVLNSPFGMLLRDSGGVQLFEAGSMVLESTLDASPPSLYAQRFVVEYLDASGVGPARVSAFLGEHEETTIYAHEFDGGSGPLNGTPVDVGSEAWTSGSLFQADGVVNTLQAGVDGQAAFLPFSPESGYVYTLSADIENDYDGWVAMGFLPSLPPAGDWTDTVYSVRHSNNGAYAWVLVRTESGNDFEAFNGPSTSNGAFGGDVVPATSPVPVEIILDTRDATWTAEYVINGSSQGVYNLSSGAVSGIGGVGFSRTSGSVAAPGAVIDHFLLTSTEPNPDVNLTPVHVSTLPNATLASQFVTFETRNKHSAIDGLEIRALVPGDANLDGIVDDTDAAALINAMGGAGVRTDGDFTLDGDVNLADYVILQRYFGFGT